MKIFPIDASELAEFETSPARQAEAVSALEDSKVILIEGLGPEIDPALRPLFAEDGLSDGISKNITLDPYLKKISGFSGSEAQQKLVESLLSGYRQQSADWLAALFGPYSQRLTPQRATFRPAEIARRSAITKKGQAKAYRYDDTKLHPDAFKKRPMGDGRILRVFSNVNPSGTPRRWKIGGPFKDFAARYLDRIRAPYPGEFLLLKGLGRTHWKRAYYDHIMLNLHDMGKRDDAYQSNSEHLTVDLPAGGTWICFTDSVLHAALAGSYCLEHTFTMQVGDMARPDKSPQKMLEALMGKPLY